MKTLKNINSIHFIGIGGISMSGMAMYLAKLGKKITGSDNNIKESEIEKKLVDCGIKVFPYHSSSNIRKPDLVVYTGAIKKDNVEMQYAIKHKIPILERSDFLGLLSETFKNVIAICGSHGKTTTTALVGHIFNYANLRPTIHLGGIDKNFGTNFVIGKNEYFITEACEFRKSFLKIRASDIIITNIDKDHMDCYSSLEEIEQTFKQFAHQTKKTIFYNGDAIKQDFFETLKSKKIISFGLCDKNNYYIKLDSKLKSGQKFSVYKNGNKLFSSKTSLVGEYNLLNIVSAIAVCDTYGIDAKTIEDALPLFKGVERRMEHLCNLGKASVYCDYAHHPTEIKALLNSCKSNFDSKIIVIFQPHTYTRTIALFNEFLTCFDECDELALFPTYSAREKIILGGRSEDLYSEIKKTHNNACFLIDKNEVLKYIDKFKNEKAMILLVGAGDINKILEE